MNWSASVTTALLCSAALILTGCGEPKKFPSITKPSGTGETPTQSTEAAAVPVKRPAPGRAFPEPVDLCIILSGEMRGYLQPCGCSRPQVGGLERRFELMAQLKANGYLLSAADLGDLAPYDQVNEQAKLKYETALRSLQAMDYAAVGIGQMDGNMSVEHALSLALNFQPPHILAANLLDPEFRFPEMYKGWTIHEPKPAKEGAATIKVGYIGLVGESVIAELKKKDDKLQFGKDTEALPKALKELDAQKPEVRILLYQGTADEMRRLLINHKNVFDVVLTKNDAADGNAPSLPQKLDDKGIHIMVGHKGRSVGVVGWTKGKPTQYRLEDLVESLELPDDKTNVCREIMKDYVRAVYSRDFLAQVPKISHPMQLEPALAGATYVGSGACAECHKEEHAIWSKSKHSHAFESLIKYGRPIAKTQTKDGMKDIGRQHDPDCVSCHVTGYEYKAGFVSESKTAYLLFQGCENCHGPGSLHTQQPNNPAFSKPMHLDITKKETEFACRKCHDLDNDPQFDFQKRWAEIKHGKRK